MTNLDYPLWVAKIRDEDGGGYLAQAIDLKGCMGDGSTEEEAISNCKEAILEWLDEAARLNWDIPHPGDAIVRGFKERQKMLDVIRQQEELINKQAAVFKDEIARLNEQIEALAATEHTVWELAIGGAPSSDPATNGCLAH